MQVIYRVVIKVGYLSATFDFIDPVAATKFADAAMINNVENEDGKARITIMLLSKEEVEKANDED